MSTEQLIAELKLTVRQLSDASYTQGVDEFYDSPSRDKRNDDKVTGLLKRVSDQIDNLAAKAQP